MWHKKRSSLFYFSSFNAIHLKLCNNIELTIPKKRYYVLCFFRFWHFWFPPNFVFIILGYLMIISERTHHKDVKSEKKFWNMPSDSKDTTAFWNLIFPPFCSLALNHVKEKALHPFLSYNSEVWGMYTKQDLKKWDSSPIEKIHFIVCKRFLEVNNKASNMACRAELGRLPPLIPINIKKICERFCLFKQQTKIMTL